MTAPSATPRRAASLRKRQRLQALILAAILLGLATGLVLVALEDSLVYFRTPSELSTEKPGRRIRLGGLVVPGSVQKSEDGIAVTFGVTDLEQTVAVRYRGILPDLFREGQGVVTEGALDASGVFVAGRVLAKHDENYMPPEVADALKKSGRWQGRGTTAR